jgi:hypothetical protein
MVITPTAVALLWLKKHVALLLFGEAAALTGVALKQYIKEVTKDAYKMAYRGGPMTRAELAEFDEYIAKSRAMYVNAHASARDQEKWDARHRAFLRWNSRPPRPGFRIRFA